MLVSPRGTGNQHPDVLCLPREWTWHVTPSGLGVRRHLDLYTLKPTSVRPAHRFCVYPMVSGARSVSYSLEGNYQGHN